MSKQITVPQDVWKVDSSKYQLLYFDSMEQLVETVETGYENGWDSKGNESGIFGDMKKDWIYGKEFTDRAQTKDALYVGKVSKETGGYIEKYRNDILNTESVQTMLSKAATMKKRKVYKESGAELCIDRVLCGDPLHWQDQTPGRKNNTIKLGINYCISCGNDDTLLAKLAALASVATDLITRAGYSVEISALGIGHGITNQIREGGIVVKLKAADEPLDINRLGSLGICGMYRDYTFRAWTNLLEGNADYSLGRALQSGKELLEKLEINHLIEAKWTEAGKQSIFIDKLFKQITNQELQL